MAGPNIDILTQLKDDPRDIRYWQAAWASAIKACRFLFVRNNANASWHRVELVKAPDCIVWVCKEGAAQGISDENCWSFDPSKTTFPPYQLDTVGEVRYGSSKLDFQNSK